MAKREMILNTNEESFGNRLARLRKAAGFSQRDLAAEIGISQRMVAYYEKETRHPPTHILHLLASALGTSADALLGIGGDERAAKVKDSRLWRRFKQVEQLPPARRRQLTQIIDAFLERERLKVNSAY